MDWLSKARPKQITPSGKWGIWILLAGRGFGKTRLASEDMAFYALTNPNSRLAVIAATSNDLRKVCIEGESGLLAVIPKKCISSYNISMSQITLFNGSLIEGFSAEKSDRLRGPQFHRAWCLVGDTLVTMGDFSQKRIDEIKPNDYVMTRNGAKKVLNATLTHNNAEVFHLFTEKGCSIIGTGNHNVYVLGKNFIPLSEITEEDKVVILNEKYNKNLIEKEPYVIGDKVVSIKKLDKCETVYDLKVENTPEFFANNILVHNCDELAAWKDQDTFSMLEFGLRLGDNPQCVITTTPRPTPLIKELVKRKDCYVTRGSTYENEDNLSDSYLERMKIKYEGTRIGRQELYAEILDDNPGALWRREDIDKSRVSMCPQLQRIVVAIDPAVTNKEDSDESGIIVVGIAKINGILHGYVLDDVSMKGTPDQWGKKAVEVYHYWRADRLIGETNNGGDMIENLIRTIDPSVAYKGVHASKGKQTRAEPISALYEQGRVHHVGTFATLEDQLCEWDPVNSSGSPDRLDALVWGLTETMTTKSNTGFLDYYKHLSNKIM